MRYALRVLGLMAEFYQMAAEHPVNAKLILPAFERSSEVPDPDGFDDPLEWMESHMMTQLMKAAATLSAINAAKRVPGGQEGGPANRN